MKTLIKDSSKKEKHEKIDKELSKLIMKQEKELKFCRKKIKERLDEVNYDYTISLLDQIEIFK